MPTATDAGPSRKFTIRVPAEEAERYEMVSANHGYRTMSDFVRDALDCYARTLGGPNPMLQSLSITEVYDQLPMTERAMLKRLDSYPFELKNDMGHPSWWRVIVNGEPIGVVQYYRGRKLCCHGIKAN